jgi:hypothetical protein
MEIGLGNAQSLVVLNPGDGILITIIKKWCAANLSLYLSINVEMKGMVGIFQACLLRDDL